MFRRGLIGGCVVCVALLIPISERSAWGRVTSPAAFQGLGELPEPGAFRATTEADGVSGDGSVVVGHREVVFENADGSFGTFQQPFRWKEAGGYQLLTELIPNQAAATAASFDGSVVVGHADGAFRWTQTAGLQRLPFTLASDVSADGTRVAGTGGIWTETGIVDLGPDAAPYALSADGQAAAGGLRAHAFRWTPAAGTRDIHRAPVWESLARDISGDGRVVVGQAMFRRWKPWHAFRWTPSGRMVDLGTLDLARFQSWAFGASGDGSVVVGASEGRKDRGGAFRWTQRTGMRNLRKELLKAGVTTVREWSLVNATGVSADGTVIVGVGTNPAGRREAFRAVLPRP